MAVEKKSFLVYPIGDQWDISWFHDSWLANSNNERVLSGRLKDTEEYLQTEKNHLVATRDGPGVVASVMLL